MSARSRSYALDIARGYCLVIMTVDHVPRNIFGRFSNIFFGPFGFFTAASAFVFISGLVSAWTYGSIYRDQGSIATWRHSLRRAVQLYAVNTCLFLLVFVGVLLGLMPGLRLDADYEPLFYEPWTALYRGLIFLYRPGYLDILPMYVLCVLMIVPVLRTIRAGYSWAAMGLSALVWLWVQIFASDSRSLNPFGYQILFIAGLVIGSRKYSLQLRSVTGTRIAQGSLILAACLLLLRLTLGLLRSPGLDIPGWRILIHLEHNGPLRVVNFALFALTVAFLWPRIPVRIQSIPLVRWLGFLGQHSLQVFAWSILTTYISAALMPTHPSRLWNAMDMLLTVSSLAIPAALHARFTQRQVRPKSSLASESRYPSLHRR